MEDQQEKTSYNESEAGSPKESEMEHETQTTHSLLSPVTARDVDLNVLNPVDNPELTEDETETSQIPATSQELVSENCEPGGILNEFPSLQEGTAEDYVRDSVENVPLNDSDSVVHTGMEYDSLEQHAVLEISQAEESMENEPSHPSAVPSGSHSEREGSPVGKIVTNLDVLQDTTVTVKIMALPDDHVATIAFAIGRTIGNLKEYFAAELKIPEHVIQIMFNGKMVDDSETLLRLGVRPHGTIQLEMSSTDPENYPIKSLKLQQEYNMPDVITVRVQTDAGTFQDVVVEIERPTRQKPFLGGYRHKISGLEFHHAGTQTIPKRRPDKGIETFCRDTQTVEEKHQHQQTTSDTSTQMTKIGCYVANMKDKLITPGKYFTAAEYHARRLKAVIILQKYLRRFLAKKLVEQLREEKLKREEWVRMEDQRKKKEKEDRLKREYERRMNPKTRDDFDLLYHALEQWRLEEVERINDTLQGAERKAALCALLEQETQLIASIGRHKLDADIENGVKQVMALLNKCAEPKKWKAFNGKSIEMDTQYTIRARELRDIYFSINMNYLSQDERLDALLTLKHTVKEHNCKLTQELVELIDREADLLMRGVKDTNLDGLRKRIATLFLQYIKTPTFNPEVARLLKVPQDPTKLRKNVYFCPSCRNYLLSTEFPLSANSRVVGRCRQCTRLDNEARLREDLSKYKLMLKNLCKAETDYGDESKIAMLLQEQDLQYLVENIWACQSALSACNDLVDLVLIRWDKYYEWSPWNCILLTKDEAAAHLKLDNAIQAYGVLFIRKIKHKHTLAKNYFSQIPAMAPFLQNQGSYQSLLGNELLIAKTNPATTQV
ncbi:IQ and ubiquitin-like domain-containing protein [Protopterus annectens]|uniref:IQ and ubiquitin-like domain-containing protein n=1 Tax=Protopterus annectens TaxID=7888 RepID=UPI001CFBEF1C|nr:IQ and ubiquitin-like domain-containing protein [Protopterus annectens]